MPTVFNLHNRCDGCMRKCIVLFAVAIMCVCSFLLFNHYEETIWPNEQDFSSFSFATNEKLTQKKCQKVCFTKECTIEANNILSKMDLETDPCQDFYSFICGKYIENYGNNDDASILDDSEEFLQMQIKSIIENAKGEPDSSVEKMKIIYDSCVSHNASELMAGPSIEKFLAKLGISNWPHIGEDFKFQFSLEEILAHFATYNQFSFIQIDEKHYRTHDNRTPVITDITASYFQYPTEQDHLEQTNGLMKKVLKYLGVSEIAAIRTIQEIVDMNQELANMTKISDEWDRNITQYEEEGLILDCSRDTNNSFVKLCSMVGHYIEIMGLESLFSTKRIRVFDTYYVVRVFPYIENYTDREIANVLALKFILSNIRQKLLSMQFNNLAKEFKAFDSEEDIRPRWKYCVNWISKNMPAALSTVYIPKKLPQGARDEIAALYKDFQEGVIQLIDSANWISSLMKSKLIKEINGTKDYISEYMYLILNETNVSEFYSKLRVSNESYLLNILEFNPFMKHSQLLDRGNVSDTLMYTPYQVNALYTSNIELLMGILLPPTFQHGRSKSLNIAALGFYIGHEFGHVLETFFEYLEYLNEEQIEDETKENYLDRKTCFINQYSEFVVENIGQKVNGTFTFEENIADHIGVLLIQKIVMKHIEEMGTSEMFLPYLRFTMQQRFYITYGQRNCEVMSKEKAKKLLNIDKHSPENFRVIGVVQNMKDFAEAFNCPVDSPMNPKNKCSF